MTPDQIIDAVLEREKGYVNRADDRGGPTNWGITQATLSAWIGRPATVQDVIDLQPLTARAIYRKQYIIAPRFDQLADPLVQELAIDTGVNHGPGRAIKWLQKVLVNSFGAKIVADGVIGPKTIAAANNAPGRKLFAAFLRKRMAGYADIVQNYPDQLVNLEGWNDRAGGFIDRLV